MFLWCDYWDFEKYPNFNRDFLENMNKLDWIVRNNPPIPPPPPCLLSSPSSPPLFCRKLSLWTEVFSANNQVITVDSANKASANRLVVPSIVFRIISAIKRYRFYGLSAENSQRTIGNINMICFSDRKKVTAGFNTRLKTYLTPMEICLPKITGWVHPRTLIKYSPETRELSRRRPGGDVVDEY